MNSICRFYICHEDNSLLFEQDIKFMSKYFISDLIERYFGIKYAFSTCIITSKTAFEQDFKILQSIKEESVLDSDKSIEEFSFNCLNSKYGMIIINKDYPASNKSKIVKDDDIVISSERWHTLMNCIKKLESFALAGKTDGVLQSVPKTTDNKNKEVIIDIPESNTKVYDFFSKIKNLSELEEVMDGYMKYQALLKKDNCITSDIIPVNTNNDSFHYADENDDAHLEVRISKQDFTMNFEITNYSHTTLPKDLKLSYIDKDIKIEDVSLGNYPLKHAETKTIKFNSFNAKKSKGKTDLKYIKIYNTPNETSNDIIQYVAEFTTNETQIKLNPSPILSANNLQKNELLSNSFITLSKNNNIKQHNSQVNTTTTDNDLISTTITNNSKRHSEKQFDRLSDWEEYELLSDSDL